MISKTCLGFVYEKTLLMRVAPTCSAAVNSCFFLDRLNPLNNHPLPPPRLSQNINKRKKVKRNYKLQREAGIFLILIENKEGIRDFIAGMLELVMVIMERRKIGRIFEIDKWKEASTCKGINMVGQGENEQ